MQPLFSHLPKIWKDVDLIATQVIDGKGMLARFLGVGDAGFQQVEDFIKEFLRSHNSEEIRDQFLPLLIDLTGEYWNNNRTRQWNRNRIQSSIPRASYKGCVLAVTDLAREYGASYCEVIDMAAKVAVEGRQGTFDEDDNTFFDSDYFHGGIFVLKVSEDLDLEGFLEDFKHIKPAGTKWYIHTVISTGVSVQLMVTSTLQFSKQLETGTNFGIYMWTEDSDYIDYVPQLGVVPQPMES